MIAARNTWFAVGSVAGGVLAGLGIFSVRDAVRAPEPGLDDWKLSTLHLENSILRDEVDELKQRVATLEEQLSWSEDFRFKQEQEFLLWQEVISSMDPQGVLQKAGILGGDSPSEVVLAEPSAPDPATVRAEEISLRLRNLMLSEGVHELDLLEIGRLEQHAVGPVVFRMLDDRGRLVGVLSGRTMHFEASVTARTVTLILGDGAEIHGGVRAPFEERRFPFSFVDPWPWIEAFPELFPGFDAGQATPSGVDEGEYDLGILRSNLNQLLRVDSANGYFGVKHIDGVKADQLRGLHLVEYSSRGVVIKHIFADRATFSLGDRGVSILLEDGASMRGDAKIAFLRGRFRIFLPNAKHAEWKAAGIPGLPEPDNR